MDAQAKPRIALIDGNSFFCSCERVMRPDLENRPLVVLSNNDGCAIARTQEAKDLGIKMGAPWFKIKHLETQGLMALSANFNLYGDLSSRMMNVVGQFSPRQEIYSIDESFLDLTGISGTGREIGTDIRQRVRQWVGIPTCVGIGSTKTLAKLANHLAKLTPRLLGVCDLTTIDQARLMRVLSRVPVGEVWGVGRRLAPKLQAMGIHTAADLAQADYREIRDTFSIVLARTSKELAGMSCVRWEAVPAARQQIMCSRSFGHAVLDIVSLQQALSLFVTRAAEKMRSDGTCTSAIQIFIRTSPFRTDPQYSGSIVEQLDQPTDDTATLLTAMSRGLRKIFRPGFKYAKAGACLLDLAASDMAQAQGNLFAALPSENRLMGVIDGLNHRFGRATVSVASALSDPDAAWHMRQDRMTPAYTTDWRQVVEIWR
ncbi:Y-family DNA polymerase [Castellaniella sp.]|uniref:Y-family DNA polymerase n=1 Tax=Castellaniella sp. TaxID=1955812 RepID=UPI002AFE9936|nr:Y-family DNA polymerase [Castellaniella sp.]